MARRTRSGNRAWLERLAARASVALIGLLLLLAAFGSIASSIAGPAHPVAATIIDWMLLVGTIVGAVYMRVRWQGRRRTRYRALMELLALTPAQFEEAVGDVLRDCGYRRVERIGRAGDLCADLTAKDGEGRRVIVQCKRLAPGSKINSPDIQKFIGMAWVHHRAERAIFVTTAEFTQPAIDLARQHTLELWDGKKLSSVLASIRAA